MDNGEVVAGLEGDWTLGGAKLFEWVAGFSAMLVTSEVVFGGPSGKGMPVLMSVWVVTTFGLALLRRRFPDEERGMRNAAMTSLGLPPPGIPAPANLQPYWSGCPTRELKPEWSLVKLGIWDAIKEDLEDEDRNNEKES